MPDEQDGGEGKARKSKVVSITYRNSGMSLMFELSDSRSEDQRQPRVIVAGEVGAECRPGLG